LTTIPIIIKKILSNAVTKLSKLNLNAEANNIKLLDDLCHWIDANLDKNIGLKELVEQSQLSSTDVQYLFDKYRQTTPMTYIRRLRQANKSH
jgi:AraC-like DNA-binding protein